MVLMGNLTCMTKRCLHHAGIPDEQRIRMVDQPRSENNSSYTSGSMQPHRELQYDFLNLNFESRAGINIRVVKTLCRVVLAIET